MDTNSPIFQTIALKAKICIYEMDTYLNDLYFFIKRESYIKKN